MVRFPCTECGRAYVVHPRFAGKSIRCQVCSAALTVPGPAPPSRPPAPPSSGGRAAAKGRGELRDPVRIEIVAGGDPDPEGPTSTSRSRLTAAAMLSSAARELPERLREVRAHSYLCGMRRLSLLYVGSACFGCILLGLSFARSRDPLVFALCLANLVPLGLGVLALRLHHWVNWVTLVVGSLGLLSTTTVLVFRTPSGLGAAPPVLAFLVQCAMVVQSLANHRHHHRLRAESLRPEQLLAGKAPAVSILRAGAALAAFAALAWGHDYLFRSVKLSTPDGGMYLGPLHPLSREPHGFGQRLYPDGTRYAGMWMEGARHGRGTMIYPGGGQLHGSWDEGKLRGEAVYRAPGGIDAPCRWDPEEQAILTEGRLDLASGSSYTGDLAIPEASGRPVPHGQGSAVFADGSLHDGTWRKGRIAGQGKLTYVQGTVYEGELRTLAPSGAPGAPPGVLALGSPHAVPNGSGRAALPDGTAVEGHWHDGVLHGKGTITTPGAQARSAIWHMGRYGDKVWPDLRLPGGGAGVPRPAGAPAGGRR